MEWQKRRYPKERGCLGCKLGYEPGGRDLSKAKCEIKVCCFREKKLETCADCQTFPCQILTMFWSKNGSKYKQYKKQVEFIRQNGYEKFLKNADTWKGPRGKLERQLKP
jgi:hypothetical protein